MCCCPSLVPMCLLHSYHASAGVPLLLKSTLAAPTVQDPPSAVRCCRNDAEVIAPYESRSSPLRRKQLVATTSQKGPSGLLRGRGAGLVQLLGPWANARTSRHAEICGWEIRRWDREEMGRKVKGPRTPVRSCTKAHVYCGVSSESCEACRCPS